MPEPQPSTPTRVPARATGPVGLLSPVEDPPTTRFDPLCEPLPLGTYPSGAGTWADHVRARAQAEHEDEA